MASLIKGQIVKHLSKFAKNVTADQIDVDVLRGKGQLRDVELDTAVLSDALELPAWLHVSKALCNRVQVRVPWTRLKTAPVQLYIDEVHVEVALSTDLRPLKRQTASEPSLSAYSALESSYGFANRVVEGMSIYVNTLEVFFTSDKFGGSIMLSRLCVESRTPFWRSTTDVRQTRVADHSLAQALLFKHVSWQLLRVEASAHPSDAADAPRCRISAPLRLITSDGRCRVAVKKSTVDGSVLAGRLQLILDNILWVATLSQLQSAIAFYRHIVELVKRATEASKASRALRSLSKQGSGDGRQTGGSTSQEAASSDGAFRTFDVVQTSYHLYVAQTDLHLCDDGAAGTPYPADWDIKSGALQVTARKFAFDLYPYHVAGASRQSWVRYKDHSRCKQWMDQLLSHYYERFAAHRDEEGRRGLADGWAQLMAQCVVLRVDDVAVYCVSETGVKRDSLQLLLSADRQTLPLAADQPLLHAELADFYYPHDAAADSPLPPGCTQLLCNPLEVLLSLRSLRWLHYVFQHICSSLDMDVESLQSFEHRDARFEATMPQLIVPADGAEHLRQSRKPSATRFCVSTATLTNCLVGDSLPKDDLQATVSALRRRASFSRPPADNSLGLCLAPDETDAFKQYLAQLCHFLADKLPAYRERASSTGPQDDVGLRASTDVWCLNMASVWAEFSGATLYYPRPSPFVSDVPLTLWLLAASEPAEQLFVVTRSHADVKVLLDHYQYLHVLHAVDALGTFLDRVASDRAHFGGDTQPLAVTLAALLRSVQVELILPLHAPISPFDRSSSVAFFDNSADSDGAVEADDRPLEPPSPQPQTAESSAVERRADGIAAFPQFPSEYDSESPSEDAQSIATDVSDDDQFTLLDAPDGAVFDDVFAEAVRGRVAVAEEAFEQPPRHTAALEHRLGQPVNRLTFRLVDVELDAASAAQQSRVNLRAHHVSMDEQDDITLRDLYDSFNRKAKVDLAESDEIALEVALSVAAVGRAAELTGRLDGLRASIDAANAANLSGFIDDDRGEPAANTAIHITDAHVIMTDKKKPDQVSVCAESAWIRVGKQPAAADEPPTRVTQLQAENASLRESLAQARLLIRQLTKDSNCKAAL